MGSNDASEEMPPGSGIPQNKEGTTVRIKLEIKVGITTAIKNLQVGHNEIEYDILHITIIIKLSKILRETF